MRRLVASVAVGVGLVVGMPAAAQDSALEMEYTVTPDGGGRFFYEFWLTLDNGDGSWSSGDGFGWLIFGDQQSAASPIADFQMDPAGQFPIGPWTTLTSSGGFHNGPTFGHVLDEWVPTAVGDSLHWTGVSATELGQGDMLFSSLVGSGTSNRPDFQVATLIPAPGAFALLGLAGLTTRRRRRA